MPDTQFLKIYDAVHEIKWKVSSSAPPEAELFNRAAIPWKHLTQTLRHCDRGGEI